jgi:hypothetical protein
LLKCGTIFQGRLWIKKCWFANDNDFHTLIKGYKLRIAGVAPTTQVRTSILLSLPIVGKRKVQSRCGIQ